MTLTSDPILTRSQLRRLFCSGGTGGWSAFTARRRTIRQWASFLASVPPGTSPWVRALGRDRLTAGRSASESSQEASFIAH